ncbi:hypothetical protein CHARACLAT_032560 [Characodon lateralis]|uniref:Uncharacterized protein n=1 Tax=Characodon lateralis TaxID=208331 RepID=A0ABU7CVG7_9TELE|nr:hypothetical protein [Characodon lateralis]
MVSGLGPVLLYPLSRSGKEAVMKVFLMEFIQEKEARFQAVGLDEVCYPDCSQEFSSPAAILCEFVPDGASSMFALNLAPAFFTNLWHICHHITVYLCPVLGVHLDLSASVPAPANMNGPPELSPSVP